VSQRARTVDLVDERDEEPRPGEPRRGEWFIWRMPRRVRVLSAAAHRDDVHGWLSERCGD